MVLVALLFILVGSVFAQPFGQRGRGKAIAFFGQVFTEQEPMAQLANLPPKQVLYFFVLYEDGAIEKRKAPDR